MLDVNSLINNSKSADNVIDLRNVVLSNGAGALLSGVNLSVARGEFVYLIGRSGSGKTTLLRSLYGDMPLAGGSGRVCGFDLGRLSSKQVPMLRRRLGIVFQNFRLLNDRNVYENLYFVLRATGWSNRKQINEQITKMLTAVGLTDKAELMPNQLSEGEQQRVSIARALINNPELVLADEPTGNLDPVTSSEIIELLLNTCRNEGRTVLVATHDFMMMDKYPARVLCCQDGTVTSE